MLMHGVDLVEVERFRRVCEKHPRRLIERLLTPREQAIFAERYPTFRTDDAVPYSTQKPPASSFRASSGILHLAGRYAAKEAVLKALGTGLAQGLNWQMVEVLPDPATGAPGVVLHEAAQARFEALGARDIALSISHEQSLVLASCVITG